MAWAGVAHAMGPDAASPLTRLSYLARPPAFAVSGPPAAGGGRQ